MPPGTLEGGDAVWLDRRTIAVGRGYRTNDSGIAEINLRIRDRGTYTITVTAPGVSDTITFTETGA